MKKCCNFLILNALLLLLIIGVGLGPGAGHFFCVENARAAQSVEPDIDLVFVIDNSGSMKKNDPHFITPQVVETFIRQLPQQTRVGMVLFDKDARLLSPMTQIAGETAEQSLITALKKIDYRGQLTNTPLGIERALYELKTNARNLAEKAIVFITDGIVDTGDARKDTTSTQWLKDDLTAQCRQLGIRIFGIALTDAADFSLIQTLAVRTDGEYFRTYQAAEISGVLNLIKVQLTPDPEPEPVLAPLPLLPMPEEPSDAQTSRQARPADAPPPSSTRQAQNDGSAKETSVWLMALSLALFITVLAGIIIFFFVQAGRRKSVAVASPEIDLDIPEARLDDLDNICGKQEPFKLNKARINIGRSQRNDIVISEPAVSGFHATIEFRNMSFYLEDQRSTNGTQLNGRKLSANDSVRLKSGDRITFAKFNFRFNLMDQKPFGDTVMLSMTALTDPKEEATIVLNLDGADSRQGLVACMRNHLTHIYGLSAKHKTFVNTYFANDTLDIIAATAHDNLQQTKTDGDQHCTPIIRNNSYYVVCSLPAPIDKAAEWFSSRHNGFTQFIFPWIRSDQYQSAQCTQLCIITFGQNPATWVSITIVPTHSDPEPVEIMSVDFLNEEERASLALDFDNHGRVI